MRGAGSALQSPVPVAASLPGIYQGHGFVEQFCAALDEVLAPVVSALDNLPAYLDVSTTPEDLLPWLATWIGMPLDVGQPTARQREVLESATALQGWMGTRRGVALAVEAVTGHRAVVQETGGATWSLSADARLPGEPLQALVVEVHVGPDEPVDEPRLDLLVAGLKPAHVVHRVEVVRDA